VRRPIFGVRKRVPDPSPFALSFAQTTTELLFRILGLSTRIFERRTNPHSSFSPQTANSSSLSPSSLLFSDTQNGLRSLQGRTKGSRVPDSSRRTETGGEEGGRTVSPFPLINPSDSGFAIRPERRPSNDDSNEPALLHFEHPLFGSGRWAGNRAPIHSRNNLVQP